MLKEDKEKKLRMKNDIMADKAIDRREKWITDNQTNDAVAQIFSKGLDLPEW